MATIPLPALSLKPVQTENPLDEYARIVGIKGALQQQQLQGAQLQHVQTENQLSDLNLSDEKAWRGIMSSPTWDGTPEGLLQQGLKAGVGPKSYLTMQQSMISMKKAAADLDETTLKNQAAQGDQYRGRVLAVVNAPQDQKQNLWDKEITAAEQAKKIQPGSISHNYPGDDVAMNFANHFALGSVIAKEAIESKVAAAKEMQAQTGAAELKEKMPGGELYSPSETNLAVKASQGDPAAQAVQAALTRQKSTVAAAGAAAGETARVGAEQAAIAKNNPALAGVDPKFVAPAVENATKVGNDYAAAKSAADDMNTFLGMARAGNKVAYSYSPVEGVLQFNSARGIKRVNMSEIESYGASGSALDRVKGFLGKQASGASIPPDVLNDMQSLHSAVAMNAESEYHNKLQVINQNYNSKFQPVQFPPSAAVGTGGGASAGPPAGATHAVIVGGNVIGYTSDGKTMVPAQ